MPVRGTLLGVLVILVAGCGGGGGKQDLRKFAMRSSGDDEESAPSPAATRAAPAPPVAATGVPTAHVASAASSPTVAPSSATTARPSTPALPDPFGGDRSIVRTDGPEPELAALSGNAASVEFRQRAIARLERLGRALVRYVREHGHYPEPAIYDNDDQPLLSWRVRLLPYLGHEALYARFNLQAAWDHPDNRKLLAEIPLVYRSDSRADERTNLLAAAWNRGAFARAPARRPAQFADGVGATVAIVEADEAAAVPWTKPADFSVQPGESLDGLMTLRGDGAFALLANGRPTRLSPTLNPVDWSLLTSVAKKEPGLLARVALPATAEPDPQLAAAPKTASRDSASESDGAESATEPGDKAKAKELVKTPPVAEAATPIQRAAVPASAALEKARGEFRELFQARYVAAKTIEQKRTLARELLGKLRDVGDDAPSLYVLLDITRQVACAAGDATTALAALEHLVLTFDVPTASVRRSSFVALSQSPLTQADAKKLLEQLGPAVEAAWSAEQFDEAREQLTLAIAVARRAQDRSALERLAAQNGSLDAAQSAREDANRAIETLAAMPDDPQANLLLGRYLCGVKKDWTNGLPILARAAHPSLREAATRDLADPTDPDEQRLAGDAWWDLATHATPLYRRAWLDRSLHWYRRCAPHLAAGFSRIKVQKRLAESGDAPPPARDP